jgi:UDP-N-acetylmuramate dehydrogenase
LSLSIKDDVPLAPLTTLELGGPARHFVEATSDAVVVEALAWAEARGLPVFVLGGGSNVVVGDAGFPGLVLRVTSRGRAFAPSGPGETLATVAAGEPWDGFVAGAVERGLAGVECLSGIPGLAGATPIQNVGAYGQEVSDTIRSVRAFDRRARRLVVLPAEACAFTYRDSVFRRAPDAYVVLAVTFALRPGGAPTLRYPELADALGVGAPPASAAEGSSPALPPRRPTLTETRTAVLALRRRKSMVIDFGDPNRRSVGSFFTNPIVDAATAERLAATAVAEGVVETPFDVPSWPAAVGRVKLSAGWLIERAGIAKGLRRGAVGVSTNHALALVHFGGGTTNELLGLAREIRDAVATKFGIDLVPEPVGLGATLG